MWQFDMALFSRLFSLIPLDLNHRYFNPGIVWIKRLKITHTVFLCRCEWSEKYSRLLKWVKSDLKSSGERNSQTWFRLHNLSDFVHLAETF